MLWTKTIGFEATFCEPGADMCCHALHLRERPQGNFVQWIDLDQRHNDPTQNLDPMTKNLATCLVWLVRRSLGLQSSPYFSRPAVHDSMIFNGYWWIWASRCSIRLSECPLIFCDPKNQCQGDPIILCEAEDLVCSLRPQSRTPAFVANWSVMASMVLCFSQLPKPQFHSVVSCFPHCLAANLLGERPQCPVLW